jgi:CO dehydrogenase/acetyl-CoA synthase beta subunit
MGLKKPVAEKMKKIRIPKWVLKILYASRKRLIKKAKTTLEADLKETEKKIYKNFLEVLKENDQKLEKLIDEQIQEISYANIVDVYD